VILPKGRAEYENLNTSFVDFSELMRDLKANGFTGYVEVSYWEYEGVLFVDNGTIINGVEETGAKKSTGPEAVAGIMRQAEEKNGSVSVYSLAADMVTMLASMLNSEVAHKDLNTDFSDLGQLVAKLQSEGHTGYVEVVLKGGKGSAMVLMRSGEIMESMLSSGSEVLSGAQALPHIMEIVSSVGAVFNVHKTVIEEAFKDTADIMVALELPRLLVVWQDVVATVERVANGHAGEGSFLGAFKDSLIERAEEYPFLDPFAGEFDYREGQITYSGPASDEFSRALGQSLSATVFRMADSLPRIDLVARVRNGLAPVVEQHADAIQRYGLRDAMPELLGGNER
jgi:hypothetical protein